MPHCCLNHREKRNCVFQIFKTFLSDNVTVVIIWNRKERILNFRWLFLKNIENLWFTIYWLGMFSSFPFRYDFHHRHFDMLTNKTEEGSARLGPEVQQKIWQSQGQDSCLNNFTTGVGRMVLFDLYLILRFREITRIRS